jgi:hypothetical protein
MVAVDLQEVSQLLVGLRDGQYPKDEVSWLVSTSWNRAAFHVKFAHKVEAEKWMRIALDLLQHAPQMESHRSTMKSALDELLGSLKSDISAMEE